MVTRRAAALLGMAEIGTAQVWVQLATGPSHALIDALHGAAGPLAISGAPQAAGRGTVPARTWWRAIQWSAGGPSMVGPEAEPLPEPILSPLRLPTTIVRVTPHLGRFWLRGGSFERREYADH
jgi:hypothetical protein